MMRLSQKCLKKLFSLKAPPSQLPPICQNFTAFHNGCPQSQETKMSSMETAFKELDIPFARARLGTFVQDAPVLGNQYLEDATLQSYLKRYVPQKVSC